MESNKLEIIKPEFNGEIQAKIKSVGEIESNMKEVKGYVEELNNYYKNITFTEETIKEAKEEKAKVNKFKGQVADYRKNIVAEYNKPIKAFEDTAKETEKLLTDTYNTINQQVAIHEDKIKKAKEQEIKNYFEKYKKENNIDFVDYEQAEINITLSASTNKLKEQAKAFIDKIVDDLKLIEIQDCKEEILVEYKRDLNISRAIQEVTNRHKLLEEEKKKQEEKQNKFIEEASKSVIIPEEKNNFKPTESFKIISEKKEIVMKFNIYDEQIEKLKKFLEISNIEYEMEEM